MHPDPPCTAYYEVPWDICAQTLGGALHDVVRFNHDPPSFRVIAMFQPVTEPAWPRPAILEHLWDIDSSIAFCMHHYQQAPMNLGLVARFALPPP